MEMKAITELFHPSRVRGNQHWTYPLEVALEPRAGNE
jgi:hypothetical protein